MSHILDALRRADEERHLGRTPGLNVIVQPVRRAPESEARSRVPLLIAFAVLLLIVIAVLVWRWPDAQPATQAPAPQAPAPQPAARVTTPPTAEVASTDNDEPAPRVRIDESSRLRSLDDVLPPPPAPTVVPAPPTPAPRVAAATELSPQDLARPITPPSAQPTSAGRGELPPPDGPTMRNLGDMPDAWRADFPRFDIGVHVYNADPGRRFILVGATRYGEGDTLAEGPLVEAIMEDGIALSWRGETVRLPVR